VVNVCATTTPVAKASFVMRTRQKRLYEKGSMLFTLLIVATMSELVEGSWLYSGLLVQNSRFLFNQVASLRRSPS